MEIVLFVVYYLKLGNYNITYISEMPKTTTLLLAEYLGR